MKRILALSILAALLGGCVVVPVADYDRHYYRGDGYYHRYGYDRYGSDRYYYRYGYPYNSGYYGQPYRDHGG